jgi:hypothetical protein
MRFNEKKREAGHVESIVESRVMTRGEGKFCICPYGLLRKITLKKKEICKILILKIEII